MANADKRQETIRAIEEALEVTPDNAPLRRLLAETFLASEQFEKAEAAFKMTLKSDPDDVRAKVGLSKAFRAQGKNTLAMVVLEDLLKSDDPPADAEAMYEEMVGPAARKGEAWTDSADNRDSSDETSDEVDGRVRQPVQGEVPMDSLIEVERVGIDFSSVGGMDTLKDEIRMKIILPMRNKDLYAAYGKQAGGGILMYGPPGCGKTHLARATAGEVNAGFLSVGLHDVLDMWIGQSEQKLHGLFEHARRNQPCVLFFDEVDALAASRSDMRQSAGRHLINQFLSELDGLGSGNEGLLILAATNAPWHLDAAFRRPGRFDRIIFVPPPDAKAREEILSLLLKAKPTTGVDVARLVAKLEGFSGADLKAVVDVATEAKLAEAMKAGRLMPLSDADLVFATKKVKPSTKEWFATARNYALYANEAGTYDEILRYLKIK